MELQLDQFKVGDLLNIVGELEELRIEKIWLSRQGSYRWVDYELRSHQSQRRMVLSVEYDDGEWLPVFYDRFPEPYEVPGAESLQPSLSWQGLQFQREEQGRCSMRLISAPGEDLNCLYADYEGPGGAALSVETFSDEQAPDMPPEVELYVGRSLQPHEVRLYAPIDLEERQGLIHGRKSSLVERRSSTGPHAGKQLFAVAVAVGLLIILAALLVF